MNNTELQIYFHHDLSLQQINALYKASGDTGRSGPDDLRVGLTLYSGDTPTLISAARLVHYADGCLLRNLCTHPDYRGCGFASALLQQLLTNILATDSLLSEDIAGLPLFTIPLPHLNAFYQRHGFSVTQEQGLSEDMQKVIRQSRRRHKEAVLMKNSQHSVSRLRAL